MKFEVFFLVLSILAVIWAGFSIYIFSLLWKEVDQMPLNDRGKEIFLRAPIQRTALYLLFGIIGLTYIIVYIV